MQHIKLGQFEDKLVFRGTHTERKKERKQKRNGTKRNPENCDPFDRKCE